MEIVLATKNPKKAEELQRIADSLLQGNVTIVSLSSIPKAERIPQAEENGKTFVENARKKAEYWANILQMPVVAEDSGIEIDALNGAPGVYTKRCMAELCPGEDINVDKPSELYPKLLKLMSESGKSTKQAYWVSAVVLAYPNSLIIEAVNKLKGEMCECAGEREFGFDQYFKPEGQSKTLAEMTSEQKDAIGPRRESFVKILSRI